VLHVDTRVAGMIPRSGLLACNHLSYVDILALGALAPMVFVAKKDVRGWPIFGGLARLGGTIFVHREKVREISIPTRQIQDALQAGALVTLFPEGTSSDGREVLPFKPTLLAAAQSQVHPIHAGCIHYPPENGNVADEICYWRDMTLVPHLLNLLARPAIVIQIGFTELQQPSGDRKELARQLHAEVERWRQSWTPSGLPPTLVHQPALSPHPEAP
jgi:1-acyl-sn-glycerol-3-phosphate acyltransferase